MLRLTFQFFDVEMIATLNTCAYMRLLKELQTN